MAKPELELALLCEEANLVPEDLLIYLSGSDNKIRPVELMFIESGISRENWKDILAIAESAGAISEHADVGKPPDERVLLTNPENLKKLINNTRLILDSIPDLKRLYRQDIQYRVAATIPERLIKLQDFFYAFENTSLGLRRMVAEAEKSLTIMVPFIDAEGLNEVSDTIKGALDRGVLVSILTRGLAKGERNVEALLDIFGEPHFPTSNFFLYETVFEDGYPISHAKVVSCDGGKEVYVGSANLTAASMDRTIEIGVFLQGSQAEHIDKFLQLVLSHSPQRWP